MHEGYSLIQVSSNSERILSMIELLKSTRASFYRKKIYAFNCEFTADEKSLITNSTFMLN